MMLAVNMQENWMSDFCKSLRFIYVTHTLDFSVKITQCSSIHSKLQHESV